VKEILIVLGLVALVVAFDWIANELAKEANWFLALTFFSVFTYFVVRAVKESKK
jgi:Ca2+/Na+ antiporter